MHHLERYTSPGWPARASHNRRSVPHAFGVWATKASRELFAFKICSQRHIKQRAQPSGAPPTARPSKCTISSVTRAWSGMTTLKPRQRSTHVLEHAQTHHGIPWHTKDARSSTSDSARNSRARHPTRPSKCTISSAVWARSGTPTPTTTEHSNAPYACFQHTQRHRGIPLHAKGARNGSTC